MKILIIRNAFSYDFGGAERLAVHLAQELAQNNIQPLIISRQQKLLQYATTNMIDHQKGWWWSRQNWSGTRALLFPVYLGWQVVLTLWYLTLIPRLGVSALHIMSKDDFIAATIAGKILGKRIVWTDPADLKHVLANHPKIFKNPVGKLVYLVSRYADCVGLVSNSERELIETSLGSKVPSNFQVIHIAGKDESVTPMKRDVADKAAVIFCSTSRLVYAKGISELIGAFQSLSKDEDGYRLWIVGDGPDKKDFEVQAGDNEYIRFIGHSESPLRYVAAADVFVHPTHHEGFSLSLTEAAMLGKPMIATRVGGNPELVNEANGILVSSKDPHELYRAMKKLGDNKDLRRKLGNAARKDYSEKFDFSTIVKQKLVPLYVRD